MNWQVKPPQGFKVLPGDLANPLALNSTYGSEREVAELPEEEADAGKPAEGETPDGGKEKGLVGAHGRDKVFLCVKVRER